MSTERIESVKPGELLKKWKSADSNTKNTLMNMAGAFVVKGGALIISLFTMPAYMRYFQNQEVLGLWFTVLSVLTWILTFDLGVGNGLRNHLAKALALNDRTAARQYISSAYVTIGATALVFSAVFMAAFGYINWNQVFNIELQAVSAETLLVTVRIVFASIMLQFVLKLITSVLYALQHSAVNNLLALCSSILTLVAVLIAPHTSDGKNLVLMAWIHLVAANLPMLVATVILFSRQLRDVRPALRQVNRGVTSAVVKLGGAFFYVQIVYLLINATNEYLITLLCGSQYVVEYQVYYKLFSLASTFFTLAAAPLWSAVTRALAERNYTWVKKSYRLMCLAAIFATGIHIAIIPLLDPIVRIWLGEDAIQVDWRFALCFAVMGSLVLWNTVFSTVANGAGNLGSQTVFYTIGFILKLAVAFFAAKLTGVWICVVIANIAALLPYCLVQPILLKRYFLKLKESGESA